MNDELIKLHLIDKNITKIEKELKSLSFLVLSLRNVEVGKCIHYHYDDGAFEENCEARRFKKRDFVSATDCWKCKKRELKKTVTK